MHPKIKVASSWLRAGYLVIAAAAMYVLVGQLSSLHGSLNDLKTSLRHDDLEVLLAVIATYLFATLTYFFIALKPLKYWRTLIVETGINTLNRLLPAGIGGIGANYVYLNKSRHTKAQAVAVVTVNTILGILANLILLALILIYFPIAKFRFSSVNPDLVYIGFGVILLLVISILLLPGWRRKLAHNFKITLRNISHYRVLKLKLCYGLLCQIGLTLAYVLALDFSLKAVHGSLPIGSLMLVYSFAVWLGAVIPAPGGVGSVEAGLVTGFLAFRIDLAQAVAAVLIFRLISFWLPLVIGIVPLVWSYKRHYL